MAFGTDQAIDTTNVLLAGASSQIGVFTIVRLVNAGFRVFAVSRKGKPEWFPVHKQVQWMNHTEAFKASKSCQYLISTGPMELVQKFLEPGDQFQTAIVFSSSSIETKQKSENSAERSQVQDMLTLESEIQEVTGNKGIQLVLLRPTLVYGCGLDTNISRLANWINRFGIMPVNGEASGLRQPVHADDLALAAIAAMLSKGALPQVMYLTGGDTLSYSVMVARVFQAIKKPVRLLHIPEWLLILLVRCSSILKMAQGVNIEMIKRQQVDLVFDDRQARQLLNYKPRPFAPTPEDFSLPNFQKMLHLSG